MIDGWVSAAFGTGDPLRFDRCFAAVHQAAIQRFPGLPCALALTSPRIQAKLAAQGRSLPLVDEALTVLKKQGCRRVAVASLLIGEGREWEQLQRLAGQRRKDFDQLILIPPLLQAERQACARTLAGLFPAEAGLTRIWIGHGQSQGENRMYHALQADLAALGRSDLRIALLHGGPALAECLHAVSQNGIRRLELSFLMLCAGHHAQEVRQESQALAASYPALSLTISPLELGTCPPFQKLFLSLMEETLFQSGIEN